MTGPQEIGTRRLRRALIASKGNMAAAARALGLNRATVCRKVQGSSELQQLLADILEESGDDLEQKLHEMGMEQNNVTAILAILNARFRSRGYGYTRNDVVISGTVEHQHLHLHADKYRELSNDELARLIEERRAQLRADEPQKLIDVTPMKT